MVGWHHWLNGHEFEKALGGDVGQGSLAFCSSQGGKESDMTEQLHFHFLSTVKKLKSQELEQIGIEQDIDV